MKQNNTAMRHLGYRKSYLIGLLLSCTALVAFPSGGFAQETTEESVLEDDGAFRLSPILINSDAEADDDAESIVAHELWVGGKVATSILDTPASVSVITEKEIRERNAQTVEEVLDYTAGIVSDYYGTDDRNDYYLIRGYQASTYRDGLTLGSMRGVREEPYAFQRVEVLKGANSTLFGASDPGGSVNFVTKVPKFHRFGEFYAQGGSFGSTELGFDFGDVVNADSTVAYRLTAKVRNGGREYDYSRDDETFLMGGLTWAPTDATTLSLVFDYLDRDTTPNSGGYPMDKDYDRSLFFGEPEFNFHNVERSTIIALLEHDFGSGLSLRANLRYSDLSDDFGYVYLYDYAGRTGTTLDRYYFGSESTAKELIGNAILQYDTSFDTIDSSTLLGLEFRDASTTATGVYGLASSIDISNPVYSGAPTVGTPYTEEKSDYTTTSIFLQQNLSFNDKFIATVGLRHDWMDLASSGETFGAAFDDSDDFSETSVRGALTYKINEEISTYVSYVESVAPPTIGVSPERGEQYELGIKYQPFGTNALISASVYDLTRNNITVPVVQGDGTILRQLIGESRVRGLEIEAKAELANNLSVIAAYTYMKSEVLRSAPVRGVNVEGNQFGSTPNDLASVWLNYDLPGSGNRGNMTFGAGARYTGSYYFTLQNDTGKSKPAVILDASFGYEVADNTQFAINISNLLGEQHVVGRGTADYYNPGRTITATLRRTW